MPGTGIIARGGFGIHAELGHQAGADVVAVKVAADTKLLQLDFIRSKEFARPTHGVILGMVEVVT